MPPEQTDAEDTFPAPVVLGPCVGEDDLFDGVRLCWLVSCGAGLVGCAGGGAGRDEAMLYCTIERLGKQRTRTHDARARIRDAGARARVYNIEWRREYVRGVVRLCRAVAG